MNKIIDWVCLISITLLVLDIMIYFCNDAIKIYNKSIKIKPISIKNIRTYTYEEKIAK